MSQTNNVLPDVDYLRHRYNYDPITGYLTHRFRAGNRIAGSIVGGDNGQGYLTGSINGVLYRVHRLIWKHYYGQDPAGYQIDHINRDRSDNRISNLRLATHGQNKRNSRANRNIASGHKYIYYIKGSQKYRVMFYVNRKNLSVGTYTNLQEAIHVRDVKGPELCGEFFNAK